MNEQTDKEQHLSVADQCDATATNDLAASILVDAGNGTLRQLLNDAADAIRAGWRAQPTAEGGIKWQCGPLVSGFTAPQPSSVHQAETPGGDTYAEYKAWADAASQCDKEPHTELRKSWAPGQRWQTRIPAFTEWFDLTVPPAWFWYAEYRRHPEDVSTTSQADSAQAPASGEVVGWLPVHSNGHKFYGAPLKTEAEAKQYINQVHQSSDNVTLIARPFTWIATPPAEIQDKLQKRMLNKLTDDTTRVREEREAFKAAHRHLELDEVYDAWGQPMFKHSHVEASWLGWIARAARKQGGE